MRRAVCRSGRPHPDQRLHRQINLLLSRLDEQQRRWFAALEATRQGRGGVQRLTEITGLDRIPLRVASANWPPAWPIARRSASAAKAAGGLRANDRMRGSPRRWWTCSAPRRPAIPWATGQEQAPLTAATERGADHGRPPSEPATVARLLRELGYSPKANARRSEARSSPERNAQFENIAAERRRFEAGAVAGVVGNLGDVVSGLFNEP